MRELLLRTLGFVGGIILSLLLILFGLAIWILLFDSDGGEPGATTIFGSLMLWPLFVVLILAGGVVCCLTPRTTLILGAVVLLLFLCAAAMTMADRARNTSRGAQWGPSSQSAEIVHG